MINLKTEEEIKIMIEGGKRLKRVVQSLLLKIKKNITTEQIDEEAEELILREGGKPSFKTVKNYYWSTCLPVNEQAVHTPPSKRILKEGDVLTLDIGMYFGGYHTDYATTFVIGTNNNKKINFFLETGKEALYEAIKKIKVGERLGKISETIQDKIEKNGFFILKELTGHGIGKELHMEPYVFNFRERPTEKTLIIKPGLTIAIEVIYSMGTEEIAYEKDNNWSIITADRSLSACFEHTIAVTKKQVLVLT
ncbi:MAG: type I methionyl aminopeptidase [Patescibacteria group bacterium]|nr:type I methionyl aminopeptidase [Patescibacteria group bacterium]